MIEHSSLSEIGTYTSRERAAIIFSCMLGFAFDLHDVLIMPFLAAAAVGGELALGMMVVVPAIIVFLAMTLLLPETRGRELAGIEDAHQRGRTA